MTHNKNTNIGLIYNSLLFLVAESILKENHEVLRKATISKKLIKKHFNPNTILNVYKEIFNSILNSNLVNEKAETGILFLNEIENFIRNKNWNSYQKEKIEFLKDVKKYFKLEELLNNKFSNYKTLVSSHLFIESCIGVKEVKNISDKVKICTTLVERLISPQKDLIRQNEIAQFIKENNFDKYTILFALNELNNNVNKLKESHKEIVSIFLLETDNSQISSFLTKKINLFIDNIKNILKETTDNSIKEKLLITLTNLNKYKNNIPNDQLEEVAEKLIDVVDLIDLLKEKE